MFVQVLSPAQLIAHSHYSYNDKDCMQKKLQQKKSGEEKNSENESGDSESIIVSSKKEEKRKRHQLYSFCGEESKIRRTKDEQ